MKNNTKILIASLFILCAFKISLAYDEKVLEQILWEAKQVLRELIMMPEENIPRSLISKAQAIGIFPSFIKGAFIIGGSLGKGIIISRQSQSAKWSPPAFFRLGGLSYGLQAGVRATDVVFVIFSERELRAILKHKTSLGADIAVTAGPLGRDAQINSDVLLKGGIFSYARSKGLFAGISLKGAMLLFDRKATSLYHGDNLTPEDILIRFKGKYSPEALELIEVLNSLTINN